MKTLFFLLIIGAVLALGGAFFEMWTIPRLEGRMPTISDYATRSRGIQERAEKELGLGPGEAPRGGPLAPTSQTTRQRQLNDARSQLGN